MIPDKQAEYYVRLFEGVTDPKECAEIMVTEMMKHVPQTGYFKEVRDEIRKCKVKKDRY